MAAPNKQSDFHVLVIGAGSVGLLIAQRLKTLGIRCTVFERENYINERLRDWSFGIYWAQSWLTECLPNSLYSKLNTAQVDPSKRPDADGYLRVLNGKTAEELKVLPTPNVYRLKRSKFRVLLAEGVDIQFGKKLSTISDNTDRGASTVTAIFEDGSEATGNLVVGADGARSTVRKYLLGPETASLQQLPLIGLHATYQFPQEIARGMAKELQGQVSLLSYHPTGCCGFFTIHIIPDHERPESWTWTTSITFQHHKNDLEGLNTPADIRSAHLRYAEDFAEPLRSALLSVPQDTVIWCEKLAHWPTVQWEKSRGLVTLAGDAAHPMTYHRGQGLNNAVHDACTFCRGVDEHVSEGRPLSDVMMAYEAELVERGREAVISSGENSMMVTDWDQLTKSAIFKQGIIGHAKREK